jgi:hypothetical protein
MAIRHLLIQAVALTASHSVLANDTVDCAAFAASAAVEPQGYASQCAAPSGNRDLRPADTRDVTDTGYIYNMRAAEGTQGLSSYTLNNLPGLTMVGNPGATIYAWDFDPTGSILFAIQNQTTFSTLGTVSTTTGAFVAIGQVTGLPDPAENITGLTIDPGAGNAYISTDSELYSFNLVTGAASLIGSFGISGGIVIDIAMNCDGQMYAHDIGSDSLYTINTTNGTAALIGSHGLAANFAQGMDFDNSNGQLYAAIYTGGGTYTYGTFSLSTGGVTPISTNAPPGEWEIAIPTVCPTGSGEIEPNDNKPQANAFILPPVSTPAVIVGNSQSATGAGLDYFRVTTSPQASAGLYRHRLIVASVTLGHVATIRGLNQVAGVIGANDAAVQASSASTSPARFLQWYTSEVPADLYVRIEGAAATTSDYALNYEVQPVAMVAGPSVAANEPVVITTVGQHTTDTDLWVYDANGVAIPNFGNDDVFNNTILQSRLERTYPIGSYILAISNYNVANHLPSPADDDYRDGIVLDFPGAVANSSTSSNLPLDPLFGDTEVTVSKTGPYDIVFIGFAATAGKNDPIFANGFECEPGFPGCESQVCEPLQLLQDPSFEASASGTPSTNPSWGSTSTNYGTAWCTIASCGTGNSTAGPRTGDWWAWLGGASSLETTTIDQTIVIPAGAPRQLNYWLRIGRLSTAGATMTVKVDGNVVQTIPQPPAPEADYSLRTVDMSAFADGGSHSILFELISPGGDTPNFIVDDVTLECAPE